MGRRKVPCLVDVRTSSWLALDALENAGIMTEDEAERFRVGADGRVRDVDVVLTVDLTTAREAGGY